VYRHDIVLIIRPMTPHPPPWNRPAFGRQFDKTDRSLPLTAGRYGVIPTSSCSNRDELLANSMTSCSPVGLGV